ncbi:hypothetical protein [Streptomyces sp. SAS_272]|uniref:hypothetical protein n=1 Tax=Streptomyces sp. SAS_272 TaxID=3412747 RepID=UPI00403CAABA
MRKGMPTLPRAAREATAFLESVRGDGGIYDMGDWPQIRVRWEPGPGRIDRAVAGLRAAQRLKVGFLDPVEDAIYLMAALRLMGLRASFHLGREVAPAAPPAGFYAWVECEGRVVSTTLPVRDEYAEVHRSPKE